MLTIMYLYEVVMCVIMSKCWFCPADLENGGLKNATELYRVVGHDEKILKNVSHSIKKQ